MERIVTIMLIDSQYKAIYEKWDNGRRIELLEVGTFNNPEDCQEFVEGICEAEYQPVRVEYK